MILELNFVHLKTNYIVFMTSFQLLLNCKQISNRWLHWNDIATPAHHLHGTIIDPANNWNKKILRKIWTHYKLSFIKMFFKVCRKKKHEAKPGEILDQVISQSSSAANKCLLYKLANYKRGK